MVYLNIPDGDTVNDKIFTFFRLLLIMKSVSIKVLFAFAVLLTAAAVGSVSAYVINFEAPSEISSGDSFVLSGTSTLPEGFSSEVVVFKKAQVGNKQVGKFPFTIGADGIWTLKIDTAGWEPGTYSLEVQKDPDYSYGGSSDIAFTFTVAESAGQGQPEQTPSDATTATSVTTTGSTEQAATQSAQTSPSTPTPAPAAKTSPVAVWTALLGLAAVAGVFAVSERK